MNLAALISPVRSLLRHRALSAALIIGASCIAAGNSIAETSRSASAGSPAGPYHGDYKVEAPPESLGLDPFYRKYADARGIPVVSSEKVNSDALLIARDIINAMLAERPDVRAELIQMKARVGIIAIEEGIMDLPEMRSWTKPERDDPRLTRCEREFYDQIAAMTDRDYWNKRARGMGGLFTTSGAETLLGTPGARYFGENIFIHEFSHNILTAIEKVDRKLYRRIEQAYERARKTGLWKFGYAVVTVQEYWAEGSQFWFNTNDAYKYGNVLVLSSDDLKTYDPDLAAVLREVYGDRHHITADVFYNHPARLTRRPIPKDGKCTSMFG